MNRFGEINVLEEFKNTNGEVYGIYWVDFKGKKKLFVRNGDSVSVVSVVARMLGEPSDKALYTIRDDVKTELFKKLEEGKDVNQESKWEKII